MADYAEALSSRPKKMKSTLRVMELRKAQNGGVIAEHRMDGWSGKEPKPHVFAANEGQKLAAHITKHLGMHIPGNAAAPEAEDEEA